MDQLKDAAKIALTDCMAVKEGESVLVITDAPATKIGYALYNAAKDLGALPIFAEIPTPESN